MRERSRPEDGGWRRIGRKVKVKAEVEGKIKVRAVSLEANSKVKVEAGRAEV